MNPRLNADFLIVLTFQRISKELSLVDRSSSKTIIRTIRLSSVPMEPQAPLVYRHKMLTNSAAGFIETQINKHAFKQVSGVEFLPEVGEFVDKGNMIEWDKFYEESIKASESFKKTLKRLVKCLEDRGVAENLKITIRDPDSKDFNFNYVLELIERIQTNKSNATKTRPLKSFVRGCCKKVEDNKPVIQGLLEIIPTDIYGVLISGGFSLILIAVEKNANERDEIQTFLAEIPEKLENIHELSAIYQTSLELHVSASSVMAAMFEVLERIVEKVTGTWKVRLAEKTEKVSRKLRPLKDMGSPFSGTRISGKGSVLQELKDTGEEDHERVQLTVRESLANLQTEIDRFQRHVKVCAQKRLGEMEERQILQIRNQEKLDEGQIRIEAKLDQYLKQFRIADKDWSESPEDPRRKTSARSFANELFVLLASTRFFDKKTGGVDEEEVNQGRLEEQEAARRNTHARSSTLVKHWTEGLKSLADPMADATECIQRVELLNPSEKNQSRAILHSKELTKWLKSKKSTILEIQPETPPDSLDNPLSFTSALIATSISSFHQGPVLAFFASHRNTASRDDVLSTPLSLVTSFNAQLLRYLAKHCPKVDLTSIAVEKFYITAKKKLNSGLKMFQALLKTLPQGHTAFIVLDGHSRLSGKDADADKIFTKLKGIVDKQDQAVLKILVTDPLVGSVIGEIADQLLWVGDRVAGYGGIDIGESTGEVFQTGLGKAKKIALRHESDEKDDSDMEEAEVSESESEEEDSSDNEEEEDSEVEDEH